MRLQRTARLSPLCLTLLSCAASDPAVDASSTPTRALRNEDGAPTCQHQCSANGFSEGMCADGWQCVEGCVIENGCTPDPSCPEPCGPFGYDEGMCAANYHCLEGCLVQDGCAEDPDCRPCGPYGYDDGDCAWGQRCTEGCLVADEACMPEPIPCDYPCDEDGYDEGYCFSGWQCLQGCFVENGCTD